MCLLVFTPDLFAFNAEDFHSNTTWSRLVIGNELRCQGGVSHDHIIRSWSFEHTLSKLWCQAVVNDEFTNNTLSNGQSDTNAYEKELTHSLCLWVRSTVAVMMLIEVHHLQTVELFGNLVFGLLLAFLFMLDTFSIPRKRNSDTELVQRQEQQLTIGCSCLVQACPLLRP